MKNKRKRNSLVIVSLLICALLTSCSYFAKNKEKVQIQIDERIKENVAAALVASERTEDKILETKVNIENTNLIGARLSIDGAQAANSISSVFLSRGQQLVGLPLQPQNKVIDNLLSTNPATRQLEESKQNFKQNEEIALRAKIQELENKLIEYGAKYETERNKNIVKRAWGWSVGVLGIGGTIALFVFFPFLILIAAQILGKMVSVIPSLAHSFGVVTKKTAQNTFKAVSDVRTQLKKERELAPHKTYTAAEVLNLVDNNLKINLDTDDKRIVNNFREKLNI